MVILSVRLELAINLISYINMLETDIQQEIPFSILLYNSFIQILEQIKNVWQELQFEHFIF
tara:strand:+ start:379 stop:561 length:183 start_codon:yes stop_codon:yes gene_type:complete